MLYSNVLCECAECSAQSSCCAEQGAAGPVFGQDWADSAGLTLNLATCWPPPGPRRMTR